MKDKIHLIIVALGIFFVLILALFSKFYIDFLKFTDRNTWATIQFVSETTDPVAEITIDECEIRQDDIYSLKNTSITIKDVNSEGKVKLQFEPGVLNTQTGETITKAVIDKETSISICETDENGLKTT
ncbi:MAG: hypothetical protein IKY53_04750 [Lachnospiraceae bacterium]|nr:hypothetical protein [Lachnospiraceae bacterium]